MTPSDRLRQDDDGLTSLDFEFDPLPEGFAATVEELVIKELAASRFIEVAFVPRDTAVQDEDLIRTNVRAR